MDTLALGIGYLLLFRLAIITAGTISLYLGYRLLSDGIFPQQNSHLEAQHGSFKIKLSNAAPGTLFALFGLTLIVAMLLSSPPQFQIKQDNASTEIQLRNQKMNLENADHLLSIGEHEEAISLYAASLTDANQTLSEASPALKGIAAAYEKQNRFNEALTYARLIHQFEPSEKNRTRAIHLKQALNSVQTTDE